MQYYDNDKPYSYEEMEEIEKQIYKQYYFDNIKEKVFISIKEIEQRTFQTFIDRDYNFPQNIFLIKDYKGKTIVGRKIRSVLRIEDKINAINCSMITAPMFLGILKNRIRKNRKIEISFYPFTNEEKQTIFNEIKSNPLFDIYYPYKYRDYQTNKEEVSPVTGWSFNPDRKQYLGYGEIHFRNFTKNYFQSLNLINKRIYDPACSTGEFLSEFKKVHPTCYTIGHDLSQEMINYAKEFVDEANCCNALHSPLKNNSIDFMFLRFLNAQVVSTKEAYKIIKVLLSKVKKDGLIICFGHTPVLITKEWFERQGLEMIGCNGLNEERDAIFQYYIMRVV